MKQHYLWTVAVLVAVVTVIAGCASSPANQVEPAIPAHPDNEITHLGYSFRIPAGWKFVPAKSVGPIFAFESERGVTGTFEPLNRDEAADPAAMEDYFTRQITKGEATPNRSVLESDVVGPIVVISATSETGEYRSYFVTEREWRFAIHLQLERTNAFSVEAFLPVVESVERARTGVSIRRSGAGGLALVSTDGSWRWVSDYAGGYVAGAVGNDAPPRLAGIWPATPRQVERFAALDDTTFVAEVSVPYGDQAARVYVSATVDGTQLFAFFTRDDELFCLSIQRAESLGQITPALAEAVLARGVAAEFVDTVVVFPDEDAS